MFLKNMKVSFVNRHIGIKNEEEKNMLEETGNFSLMGLINNSINLENYENHIISIK